MSVETISCQLKAVIGFSRDKSLILQGLFLIDGQSSYDEKVTKLKDQRNTRHKLINGTYWVTYFIF